MLDELKLGRVVIMLDELLYGLKLGQVEVWLDEKEDISELIDAIVRFFELEDKKSVSYIYSDHSRVIDQGYSNSMFIKYCDVPSNLKIWLLESSYIKDKYAFCAFIGGWIMSRGKDKGHFCGRHDAFVESEDKTKFEK